MEHSNRQADVHTYSYSVSGHLRRCSRDCLEMSNINPRFKWCPVCPLFVMDSFLLHLWLAATDHHKRVSSKKQTLRTPPWRHKNTILNNNVCLIHHTVESNCETFLKWHPRYWKIQNLWICEYLFSAYITWRFHIIHMEISYCATSGSELVSSQIMLIDPSLYKQATSVKLRIHHYAQWKPKCPCEVTLRNTLHNIKVKNICNICNQDYYF